ncbi:histone deacetylase 8 [Phytophthora cinnamomi]|uniref:histone deacetylase 8 n=1 Tax=Phytophthora cinnamomi TaxID=4785 RepID=UPI00355A5A7F|nr:histone deacetylase 8 [Phytophthora cinnamomi]
MVPSARSRRRDVVYLHSPAYLEALSRLPVHQQRERMTLELLTACFPDGKLAQHLKLLAPTVANRGQLEAFHSRDYVDALHEFGGDVDLMESGRLASARKREVQSQLEDFGLVDDAYVFPGLFEYCCYVAGATLAAVDALLHLMRSQAVHEQVMAPAAINLRGGRHHAMRSKAIGFCYVNDVMLGVQRLISRGCWLWTSTFTMETALKKLSATARRSQTSRPIYMSAGSSRVWMIGAGRGKLNNVNSPLQRGITDDQFLELFQRIVGKAVETVQPEAHTGSRSPGRIQSH